MIYTAPRRQGGAKSLIVLLGSGRRQAIGRYPALSLAKAREKAKIILAERAIGKHQPSAISWKKAVAEYLEVVKAKRRPHTHHEYARTLKRYFPFGVTRLGEITKLDISQKLARLKDAPSQQNHAAIYVKVFFNWAIAEGYLETNPLQHYKQAKKTRRKRILTDDELQAVWNAAGEIGGMFGVIVQLIILSGQRRGEIAALLESYYCPRSR
jgi:integrase